MNDKVSIIVPLYNMAELVGKCLDSLKAQTYQNIEYIVVDDGSQDDSGKIADQYAMDDSRFKIIHHEVNKGIACGFITGIKNSTGKYVTFVDSDNYISEVMIERLVELKEKFQADVVQGEALCYTSEQEIEGYPKKEVEIVVLDNKQDIREDFLFKRHITNNLSVKLFNREWFDDIEIPEGRQVVDTTTMLQMVGKSERYVCTNEFLYYAYMPADSISRGEVTERRISDTIYANDFYCGYINKYWPEFSDYSTYRTASTSIWAYTKVNKSRRIDENKKKELLRRFRIDFLTNYKGAKDTDYYNVMPRTLKKVWALFYRLPFLYKLIY